MSGEEGARNGEKKKRMNEKKKGTLPVPFIRGLGASRTGREKRSSSVEQCSGLLHSQLKKGSKSLHPSISVDPLGCFPFSMVDWYHWSPSSPLVLSLSSLSCYCYPSM